MRSFTLVAAAGVAVVLGVASSAAAQGFPFPKTGGAFSPAPQQSKPWVLPPTMKDEAEQQARRELRSRIDRDTTVVCGMTVSPAIPEVDPKSIKPAPNDRKYTMRSVPPSLCGSNASTVVVPPPTVAPR
jgi:hypothetical protein